MCLLITSCGEVNPEEEVKGSTEFKWPVGKFLHVDDHSGYYYEEWSKGDSNTYLAEGHFVSRDGIDTLFSLNLRLVYDNEKTKMFYTVMNSEEDKELEFTLTKAEDNLYVFENPFRDFPSIMQYRLFGDTAIEVTERGFEHNKEQVWKYTVRKIN